MRIALLGDSQMQGLAPHLKPALEAMGAEVTHVTANQGWSTARFLGSGVVSSATGGSDLAILCLGGNDDYGPSEASAYLATLEALRRQIQSPHVLWLGPATSMDTDVEARHLATARLQRELVPKLAGATWLDSRPYTTLHFRSDGVHFTSSGYELWAARALDAYAWITTSPLVRAMYFGNFGLFTKMRRLGG